MKTKSMVALLILAGILGIVAALWSGSGQGLGPVSMGEGETISSDTRNTIMLLTLIGGIGGLLVGFLIKRFGRKSLGIASLFFGAFMAPSLIQGNVLFIASILLLIIVGITLLIQPVQKRQIPTTG
jgi:MFS family permease